MMIFIASTTSILIPISWGGVSYSWSSWRTLVPLILGFAGEAGFVLWEVFGVPRLGFDALVPLILFKNRTTAIALFETAIHGLILWCLLYYMPLYYEAVKNETPILTGICLFPDTFTVAPAAGIVGIIITKTGRYRWALWSGWVITILGLGLLWLMDVRTSTVQWVFITFVGGLGIGMLFSPLGMAIQASSTPKTLVYAVAAFTFFRAFGQSLGVAIGGTIFQNQMKNKLMAYPLLAPHAEEYAQDAAALVQTIKALRAQVATGGAPATVIGQLDGLVQAYADTIKVVNITLCGLAVLAASTSVFIEGYDIDMPLVGEQGYKSRKKNDDTEKVDGKM